MRSRFFGRATLIVTLLVVLLITVFGCLLFFLPQGREGIVAELKGTDKADELVCELPPLLKQSPPSFGFITWRYKVRATYEFVPNTRRIINSVEAKPPPPTSMMMIPIGGVPAW